MTSKKKLPPSWAERILSWYCRRELFEDLSGDLREYFDRNVKSKGLRRAQLIYVIDVLKFLRLYTVRKPSFYDFMSQWMMFGSYFKTSGRSIVRNRLFSAINIVGLAVSMSVGLLVIAMLLDFHSYDSFHVNKDRIYRLYDTFQTPQHSMELASVSVNAGKAIEAQSTGIEKVVLMRNGFGSDAHIGDKVFPIDGLYANEKFFEVFSFPLLAGNPTTALKEPYSLALTEKSAKRLFGTTDALGKSVKFDTTNYLVTAIVKDVPNLSHIKFDVLVSFSTAEIVVARQDPNFLAWNSIWQNYVYLLLPEQSDLTAIQRNLDKISTSGNLTLDNAKIELHLQPFNDIVLGKRMENRLGANVPALAISIIIGLALVIILSASFNYTNLSIARSFRRSREVGIRKVIGALRLHVLTQFITESLVISMLALVLAFPVFLLLRQQFLLLNPNIRDLVTLDVSFELILWFVCMAVVVGIVSGLIPAMFFSRINAMQVLKNMSTMRVFRHVTLRKVLIVAQYTVSIMFITTTIVGYSQYKSFVSFDLGFSTENILNIRMQGNPDDDLYKKLLEIPGVQQVSRSMMITSLGSIQGTHMKYTDSKDSSMVWLNNIDENYIPIHGHVFRAGGNFKWRSEKSAQNEILVNEQVLKRFNIGEPQQAIGEVVRVDGKNLTITGVLKDFHYGTVERPIEPVMFRYSPDNRWGYLNVKIQSPDLPATVSAIEKAWKNIDDVHPIDARFYDDQIQEAYSQFSVMIKVIGFVAFLAVCIASFGLFGMVVFTTETRLKEISIRKVLGASEARLVLLLSRGFLFLLAVSGAIAIPATWIFFDEVILTKFAYHQPIGIGEIISGLILVVLIALFMIGLQTLKVARTNPATVLKND